MRKFDSSFRNDLRKTVESLEKASGIELIVAVLPRATNYTAYFLGTSLALSLLVLTIMMFIPTEFWYVLIYIETVGIGIIGAVLLWLFPGLLRLLVGKRRLKKNAALKASTIFQKAKVYETRERIGILLVYSWFEKSATLLVDKGATAMIPADEIADFEEKCQAIFLSKDPAAALLSTLQESQAMFATYIPADIHPVNELPDELWME